jgi:hypothetical protein
VPYAIDFMNPAPDMDINSLTPHYFDWVVRGMADMAIGMARAPGPQLAELRWSALFGSAEGATGDAAAGGAAAGGAAAGGTADATAREPMQREGARAPGTTGGSGTGGSVLGEVADLKRSNL